MHDASPAPLAATRGFASQASLTPGAPPAATADPPRPNFVVILTDDQRWDSIGRCTNGFNGADYAAGPDACMPFLQQDLMQHGTTFTRGYVTTSLCCPSRAGLLTGQYARHTNVTNNGNGFALQDQATLATWLDDGGYRTGLFGKYLNGYGGASSPANYVPPGWDSWHAYWDGNQDTAYSAYQLLERDPGENPSLTGYSTAASTSRAACAAGNQYPTDLLCRRALEFLGEDTADPFFVLFSPPSPHTPAIAPERWSSVYADLALPTYPNRNRLPAPNPPSFLPSTPLSNSRLQKLDQVFRAQLATNRAVDDAIDALHAEIDASGRLDNTVWVFLSDNGLGNGEHRWTDKSCQYEECHRVPFVVVCPPTVCPGAQTGAVDTEHIVLGIDIAPTFAELAGVTPTIPIDGSSLAPVLNNSGGWRSSFLLEDQGLTLSNSPIGMVADWEDGHTYKYVEFRKAALDRELYDLTTDPWELVNLAGDGVHGEIQSALAAEVADAFTDPVVTIESGPSGTVAQSEATFTWSSTKPVTFACRLDTTSTPCGSGLTGSVSFEGLSVESHTFHVTGQDEHNNVSKSAVRTFTVTADTTAPAAPALDGRPSDPSTPAVSFAFTHPETGVGFECRLDDGFSEPCTSPTSYLGLSEGVHGFEVRAHDPAGNVSSAASFSWTVDATPPTAPELTEQPADPSGSDVTFAFTSTESPVTFSCSLDGVVSECSSPTAYGGLASGEHTFEVAARDVAGNLSAPTAVTWTVEDFTPPTAPVLTETPADPSGPTAAFEFVGERGVVFACSLDETPPVPCTSPHLYSDLLDGPHAFQVSSTDASGNTSDPASFSWTVDGTGPIPPELTETPADPSGSEVVFSFAAQEAGVTFDCSLDGAPYTACISPQSYTGLDEGPHLFLVRGVDRLGNEGGDATWSWTVVDTEPPPTPTFASTPADPSLGDVSFAFTGDEIGTTFACSLDGAPYTACSSPQTFSGLASGDHRFDVTSSDGAGNVSTPASFTWTVDVTPPPAPVLSQTPTNPSRTDVSFAFTDEEAGVGFLCALDGSPLAPCTSPASYTGLAAGDHTHTLAAVDELGNRSSNTTYAWTVDAVAPVVSMRLPIPDSLLASTSVKVSWSGSDNDGVVRYDLFQSVGWVGPPTLVLSSSVTSTTRTVPTGTTACYVVVGYDAAGNAGASSTRCAAVPHDDRAPTISWTGPVSRLTTSAYQNTLTVMTGAGHAEIAFTGRSVGMLAREGPTSGIMRVSIDGVEVQTIDLYATTDRTRVYVFKATLDEGAHVVTLAWTGEKNAASSGTGVGLDGLAVIEAGG